MCGLAGGQVSPEVVRAGLDAITHRGPDGDGIITVGAFTLGHVRLAIQDLTTASSQPWPEGSTVLTFNGELWHPELLRAELGGGWRTTGDTEPLARLLDTRGPGALAEVHGMFALAWTDAGVLYLARDAYGEVPLHYGWTPAGELVYASEIRALQAMGVAPSTVAWFPPGHILTLPPGGRAKLTTWDAPHDLRPLSDSNTEAAPRLRDLLLAGAYGRMTADASVAALISGGLDSSAVLGLLVEAGARPEVYTAVYDSRSPDLKHARIVASHFGLNLHEVQVPEPTEAALGEAVLAAEMPHKAQVEITLACLHLARAVAADGHRVVLSGEGSDELWASYGNDYFGIRDKGWHRHRYESFTGQHRKNFARTNKVFMAAGVEVRLPFLDPPLVRYALGLTQSAVTADARHLKAVLAQSVEGLGLPRATLWRAKLAFQTGARLDQAAASLVANPRRFYAAEFARSYRGVRP